MFRVRRLGRLEVEDSQHGVHRPHASPLSIARTDSMPLSLRALSRSVPCRRLLGPHHAQLIVQRGNSGSDLAEGVLHRRTRLHAALESEGVDVHDLLETEAHIGSAALRAYTSFVHPRNRAAFADAERPHRAASIARDIASTLREARATRDVWLRNHDRALDELPPSVAATPLSLVLDNLRSAENVGAIFRAAEAAGLAHVHCAMSKTSWLSLRPAGAPEASLSARSYPRLPQAPASLGLSAAWRALASHRPAVPGVFRHRYCCGITPVPPHPRLLKTALGSAERVRHSHRPTTLPLVRELRARGVTVWACVESKPNAMWPGGASAVQVIGRAWPHLGDARGILWRWCIEATRRHSGRISVGLVFDLGVGGRDDGAQSTVHCAAYALATRAGARQRTHRRRHPGARRGRRRGRAADARSQELAQCRHRVHRPPVGGSAAVGARRWWRWVIVEYKNLENKGIWRIREFGEYRNLENIHEFGETIGEIVEFEESKT